jgi:hypothetical protein
MEKEIWARRKLIWERKGLAVRRLLSIYEDAWLRREFQYYSTLAFIAGEFLVLSETGDNGDTFLHLHNQQLPN